MYIELLSRAGVQSPLAAASVTFGLKAGGWFRRARLVIVSPDLRENLARREAETPRIVLCRFPEPALPAQLTRVGIAEKISLLDGQ